jgi:N-acetylmuramoyl-L-alanine amidase
MLKGAIRGKNTILGGTMGKILDYLKALFSKYLNYQSNTVNSVNSIVPVSKHRVGISPGHCNAPGEDPGCVAKDGTTEAGMARTFALKLLSRFKRNTIIDAAIYGFDEVKKDYEQRVKDSNAANDEFYIPIHFNASTDEKVNGWLVMIDPGDKDKNPKLLELAISVSKNLQKVINIGLVDFDAGKKDGVMVGIGRPIYELLKPNADTIYCEFGFLSNPTWLEQIKKEPIQDLIVDAVATAIEEYYKPKETV